MHFNSFTYQNAAFQDAIFDQYPTDHPINDGVAALWAQISRAYIELKMSGLIEKKFPFQLELCRRNNFVGGCNYDESRSRNSSGSNRFGFCST